MISKEILKLLGRIMDVSVFDEIFDDEPIPEKPVRNIPLGKPKASPPQSKGCKLPPLLQQARAMERNYAGYGYQRSTLFYQQAMLLKDYEDDYVFRGRPASAYYTSYQALSDGALRGYFTWRTNVRKGYWEAAPEVHYSLYAYELLNQIGIQSPTEGFEKLQKLGQLVAEQYGYIAIYFGRWLMDYVAYYGLSPQLLADQPQMKQSKAIGVLEDSENRNPEEIMCALQELAASFLERSRFYRANREDMEAVICRVFPRLSLHYKNRTKRTFTEQLFGPFCLEYLSLFQGAIFCDPLKRRDYQFSFNSRYVYICRQGSWSLQYHGLPNQARLKLTDLLKTIDAIMRLEYKDKHPIQTGLDTKWIIKLIQEETQSLLQEKARKAAAEEAAKKQKQREKLRLTIDPARLEKIRQDAEITRDKLIVEEETEPVPEQTTPTPSPEPKAPAPVADKESPCPLKPGEYRLLQCLLYGGDLSWVRTEGFMLSVLVDGINETLYDTFLDTVVTLEGEAQLVEDYIEDLKEMVHP